MEKGTYIEPLKCGRQYVLAGDPREPEVAVSPGFAGHGYHEDFGLQVVSTEVATTTGPKTIHQLQDNHGDEEW